MKITSLSIRIIRRGAELWHAPRPVPADDHPYFDFPLVTIGTDEGIEGHAMEYCPLGQGRATAYGIKDIYSMELLGGNPLHHEAIWQRLRMKQRHLYNLTPSLWSTLDVALWDIKGKAAGQSIATLLGQYRDKVPLYATCPPQTIATPEEAAAAVRAKIAQGFAGVKLQLSGGAASDIPRLRAAREAAGPGYPLMLDSSAVLTFDDALKIGRELDELDYEWFEEPFPDAHVLQLKKLAAAIRTPVLAAETVSLFELPRYMLDGAVDLVRGDAHHKGGVTGLMKALGMCEMTGFGLEIHTAATPLHDIANLHCGCATRLSRFLESHHEMFRFGLKGDPLRVHPDGCQHVPAGPGLGVELDWDWIDDHTVEIVQ
jgi:L-alanine-DL-glutamate epimerase-like enolase superfamily enzyme